MGNDDVEYVMTGTVKKVYENNELKVFNEVKYIKAIESNGKSK